MKFEGTFQRDVDANLDVQFFAYICKIFLSSNF